MIRNDEELTVVRKQLHPVEDALASLRRNVFPKNPRNYEIFSEGYVEQIQLLRAEIDAYLGIPPAFVPDNATDQPMQPISST